ncbi:caspase-8-like [Clarias gariepinus]|nr:caspase-8-like isoform X2 [Clarias gariepinus]XP_053363930.1 caspase-8-like isoform X2 [Clarias gariepinus]XP_053363931.1 caspase-8-like isoform X2 [Clarias gariepinus]XP_053363933.1 caspase-8-like isoform X2 [Clarias gariepinus]
METVRKNKPFLINTLSTDASTVLQHVQSDDVILQRDYDDLKQPNHTGRTIITNLLDILMRRGDETCRKFLKVLEKKELQDNFPQLKDLFTPEQPSHERKDPAKATGEVNITPRITSRPVDEYQMSSVPRGDCLIINNMDFGGEDDRQGSEKDEESLEKVFKWLGFTVEVKRNRTAEQMKAILRTYSQKQHGGDCFICCILSHGTTKGVCGTDQNIVQGDEIYNLFNGTSCPSLISKPKVFFIQACRGKQHHPGVQADGHKEEEVGEEEEEDLKTDAVQMIIPDKADFLVARSTVKGYYSFRNTRDGSWFIQSLCEQLERGCPMGEDVCSILVRVNGDVSTKIGKPKQMPEQKVTLRKKLVFRVPQ